MFHCLPTSSRNSARVHIRIGGGTRPRLGRRSPGRTRARVPLASGRTGWSARPSAAPGDGGGRLCRRLALGACPAPPVPAAAAPRSPTPRGRAAPPARAGTVSSRRSARGAGFGALHTSAAAAERPGRSPSAGTRSWPPSG